MITLPPKLAAGIVIIVAAAFIITFSAQFIIPGYEPETAIYGMFSMIAVAAFSQRRKGGNGA